MRLTLNTDYSLRVLIHVGLCGDKLTTINDIAQNFGISKAHLMKVVNDLGQKHSTPGCSLAVSALLSTRAS
jgi:Rrf2 family transcriptional regulator, nitric oxide-sensitive transcriptional repressor